MPIDPVHFRSIEARYRISSLIARTEEPLEALRGIIGELVDIFRASSGSIALLNPDTGKLEIEVHKGLPIGEGEDPGLNLGQGITGWVAFHGRSLLVPDVRSDPRYVRVREQVACEMAVPLLESVRVVEEASQVLGVINLDCDVVGAFTPADLVLLEQCAAEASAVMQRLWRLGRLRVKAHQLEVLIECGQAMVAKLDEQGVLDTVVRDAGRLVHACASAVYLHDARAGTLRMASWCSPAGDPAAYPKPEYTFPVDDCGIAGAVHTRRTIEFADIHTPDFLDLPDIPKDPRLRSMLLTPVAFDGEVVAVLALFTDRVHRFNNDEKRFCSALASIAAVALQNARLYARVFQSEDSLRRNEQLTTLGLLAAEIAHEIRNPLTVIKLLFGYLGLDFPEDDQRRTDVRVISEKLDQLEAIVSRVLNFAKAPSSLHSRWSVADIIDDTLVLIRLKLSQGKIQLRYAPPARPLLIDAHKGQIQQVLLNLLINSTQAMPGGGTIDVEVSEVHREEAHYVAVDVRDSGGGIPEPMRDKVFESFLSGRPDGTGLGLAIAKRILRGHHGDIELLSTGTTGTTMRILIPQVRAG